MIGSWQRSWRARPSEAPRRIARWLAREEPDRTICGAEHKSSPSVRLPQRSMALAAGLMAGLLSGGVASEAAEADSSAPSTLVVCAPLPDGLVRGSSSLCGCPAELSGFAITGLPLPRPAGVRIEANLRAGPSTQHPIVGTVQTGVVFDLVAECAMWRLARSVDGNPAGWVHAALLRPAQ